MEEAGSSFSYHPDLPLKYSVLYEDPESYFRLTSRQKAVRDIAQTALGPLALMFQLIYGFMFGLCPRLGHWLMEGVKDPNFTKRFGAPDTWIEGK